MAELAGVGIEKLSLVFLRLTGLFMFMPYFNKNNMPGFIKLLIVLGISLPAAFSAKYGTYASYIEAVTGEILLGSIFGLIIYMTSQLMVIAGGMIDMTIGINAGIVYDPATGAASTLIEKAKGLLTVIVFYGSGLYRIPVYLTIISMQKIPVGTILSYPVKMFFLNTAIYFGEVFKIALGIALPFLLISLGIDLFFGFLMRAVPGLSGFFFSLPIKQMVTIIFLIMILSLLVNGFNNHLENLPEIISRVMER